MSINFEKLMSMAPNEDKTARYAVVGYPQDGGKPVVKMTDSCKYAIRLFKCAIAFNGHGRIIDRKRSEYVQYPPVAKKEYHEKPMPVNYKEMKLDELYYRADCEDQNAINEIHNRGWMYV